MLQTLRIRNLALIDDVELEFADGFNVLTGETGAGKSIVVGALNLVLGGRASADLVRSEASEARVEALFSFDAPSSRLRAVLDRNGIALEDGQLLVARVVSNQGRSRAYASGNLVTLNVLSEIGDELVDLHGQHEHQSLLKPGRQLDLIDGFGGLEELAGQVHASYERVHELSAMVSALESDDRERTRQIEFRRFEVEEIDQANLVAGEEEELKSRRNLMMNAERIFSLASSALAAVYASEDEPAAVDAVDRALGHVEELADIDAAFGSLAGQLADARATLEAVAEELRRYTDELNFEPGELDAANERLSIINDLARKYGDTTPDILAYADEARKEIDDFEQRDERLEQLRKDLGDAQTQALAIARKLSTRRRNAAGKLEKEISSTIDRLGMAGAQFAVEQREADLGPRGIDKLEFMLAANTGEPSRPLRKVASGGEMSRLMLALKSVFAEADDVPTLIFDEIDAGVGGTVAGHVADRIATLGKSRQIVCVTHLPQIAAAATRHFNVAKSILKGRTKTRVHRVEDASRVDEVARLLDGNATDVSLQHAEALLKKSGAA